MNERLTPETDALWHKNPEQQEVYKFARKLERERDELAAKLVANEAYQAGLLAERDEARKSAEEWREHCLKRHVMSQIISSKLPWEENS